MGPFEDEPQQEEDEEDDEEAEEDRAGVEGRGALKRSLMLVQSISNALLEAVAPSSFPSPSPSILLLGMRRTMLSMARAYASPSSDSSARNAETTDEVEEEMEAEELVAIESDGSAACIRDATRERADAKGANDSSGYPLLHSMLSAAMLNRPKIR